MRFVKLCCPGLRAQPYPSIHPLNIHVMSYKSPLLSCLLTGLLLAGCEDHRIPAAETIQVTPFATGLAGPIGLEKDASGIFG